LDRVSESRRWISEAEWDLESARVLRMQKRFNASAFYSQQASEKAVEAALYNTGEIPIGHSVRELLEKLREKSGVDISALLPMARELDRPFRRDTRMRTPRERLTRRMMKIP
jgi:HEPN domain-containing protein